MVMPASCSSSIIALILGQRCFSPLASFLCVQWLICSASSSKASYALSSCGYLPGFPAWNHRSVTGPHRHQAQLFISILCKGFVLFIKSTQAACSRTGCGGFQAAQNCYFLHNIFLQKITCRHFQPCCSFDFIIIEEGWQANHT